MTKLDRFARKSYAMRRMTLAIERAIRSSNRKEKERASRWAAAWGLLCGIRTEGVNLKSGDVETPEATIAGIAALAPSSSAGHEAAHLAPSVALPPSAVACAGQAAIAPPAAPPVPPITM